MRKPASFSITSSHTRASECTHANTFPFRKSSRHWKGSSTGLLQKDSLKNSESTNICLPNTQCAYFIFEIVKLERRKFSLITTPETQIRQEKKKAAEHRCQAAAGRGKPLRRALLGEDGAGAAHIFNASFPETTYGVGCKVKHLSFSIKS